MPATSITRLTNIALRSMTLASKFLLIFFLAKFLEPAELGLYGLLVVTISYALYLVGLDFHTHTTREIIKRASREYGDILKNQATLTVALYAIFTPALCLIFTSNILPSKLIAWFFPLLILEHLAQELNRILVALSKQLAASIVLFLRSGAWAIPLSLVMINNPEYRNIECILLFWTLGGICACSLSIWNIYKENPTGWHKPANWNWIKSGIIVALPFLISTLALRGIFTLDRFFIESYVSLEALGAYVLFISLSSALISFLDAGVFVFTYPSLISAHNTKNEKLFKECMMKLTKQSLIISSTFSIATILLLDPILRVLGKQIYIEQQWMYPLTMLATFIFCMGMIPQHGLYAKGKDKNIILSHIAALAAFIISTHIISIYSSETAVPLGLCIGLIISFIWKTYSYQKTTKTEHLALQHDTPASIQ